MKKTKEPIAFDKLIKKYLLIIPCLVIIIALVYLCFYLSVRYSFERASMSELRTEGERTAYEAQLHIENRINSLIAFGGLVTEEEELSSIYTLNRLKAVNGGIDFFMLGVIDEDLKEFINTENQRYSVAGYNWFHRLCEGKIIRGENFEYSGTIYTLYAVPVYRGNKIIGGVGCIEAVSEFDDVFLHSGSFNYAIVNENKTIIAESEDFLGVGTDITNILTEENMNTYNNVVKNGKEHFVDQKLDEENCRILFITLPFNDYVMMCILTDDDYDNFLAESYKLVVLQYIVFFIILMVVVLSFIVFFHLANKSLIDQLNRFITTGKEMKIAFLRHSPERPFRINYQSSTTAGLTGGDEIKALEDILYNEDKRRILKSIEDFAVSPDTIKKLYFRIIIHGEIHWVRDDISKGEKTNLLVSVLSLADDYISISEEVQILNTRLSHLSYVSSYYVFELDISNKKLYVSENLKERLGYSIEANDCFKKSVREKLIHPSSRSTISTFIEEFKRGKRSLEGEISVISSAGDYVNFHIKAEIMGTIIKDELKILAVLNEV